MNVLVRAVAGFLFWVLPICAIRAGEPAFHELLSKLRPKTPTEALAAFHLRRGFRIELVCAEPLVQDPIAIDWGPDGRLWVVEMGDYPTGAPKTGRGKGRIRCLEDTDGDGRYDRSTVWLDGLSFPTGLMVWRKGILVTCAPEIFYAEDTNGDGKADRRECVYRGFVQGNPQHRVNGLRWGLDGWIYVANGDSGGRITSPRSNQEVDIHGRDLRIRPDSGDLQTATGMSQFGRCRDDFGNWFGGRNLEPIWHCVLPDHYLRRNPYLVPPDPCVDLLDPPTCAPVFPVSSPLPRFNEFWTLNRFTAACGIGIYRDVLFGPEFAHACFICEPAYNLVFHGTLIRDGVTFKCRRDRAEQRSEFLASTDHWFRPTQVRTGPDGALWVVDMYRLIIEHPDYIPERWHDQLDFRAGRGMGRIYRVLPTGKAGRHVVSLTKIGTRQLVQAMDTPNGPRRDMVQQLLIHRGTQAAVAPLERLAVQAALPAVRVSALCTLDGLHALRESVLIAALKDGNGEVRRQAVRLSEDRIAQSAALQKQIKQLSEDPDVRVRLQLAFSLGQWHDVHAAALLGRIVRHDSGNPYVQAAVLSSALPYPGPLFNSILARPNANPAVVSMARNLMQLCWDAGDDASLARGLARVMRSQEDGSYQRWQFQLVADLADMLQEHGRALDQLDASSAELGRLMPAIRRLVRKAQQVAFDDDAAVETRVQALRLVGCLQHQAGRGKVAEQLAQLLVPQNPLAIQLAAVVQLARLVPSNLAQMLLAAWAEAGPQVRSQILDILMRRENWTKRLLDAIESGTIAPSEIGAVHRNRLLLSSSVDVASRAADLFGARRPKDVGRLVKHYLQQCAHSGDGQRGRAVFIEHCTTCHQLEGEGTNVGPDLLALTDRSTQSLLVSLLDPNQAVEPRYVEYSAVTTRGHVLSGIIVSETGNSIVMVDAQGKRHVLLRNAIDELASTGRSLMPEGLDKLFERPSDICDLIAYLQSLSPQTEPDDNRKD